MHCFSDRFRVFNESLTLYYTSKHSVLRTVAAHIAGLLFDASTDQQRRAVNMNALISSLIKLGTSDQSAAVRLHAVRSLSLMHGV